MSPKKKTEETEQPIRIGYALTGSFCTFAKTIEQMKALVDAGYDVTPIMSFNARTLDTRFGRAEDFVWEIETLCKKDVIATIQEAEPIGPKKMFDCLVVAPCTGNTLAKLANSITDTPVTMAVKSHLRGSRPVVIAVSTNDALSGCAKNIGTLFNLKNYYFVPVHEDSPDKKPTSLVARFELIPETVRLALEGIQIQPMMTE